MQGNHYDIVTFLGYQNSFFMSRPIVNYFPESIVCHEIHIFLETNNSRPEN